MDLRIVLLIPVLLLVGCADSIPFAGGELDGAVTSAPAEWSATAGTEVVRLETRPKDPYSINLWMVDIGPVLYVHAGDTRTNWVEHIEVNPAVRLGVGDSIYELNAVRVDSAEEFAAFADAYEVKYDLRPRNEDVTEAYLYRLESGG